MKLKILAIFLLLFFGMSVNAQGYSVDIGYPAVDEMETRVLGQAYPRENIYRRLDRLETTLFKSISNAPLSERVDRLRKVVLKESVQAENNQPPPMMYSQVPQDTDEYSVILYELEKKLLGSVYITDPVDVRVARLETRVFSQASDSHPMKERIQRLCAYSDAQASDDYYANQSQMRQYNSIANKAKLISVLFMILQALLL